MKQWIWLSFDLGVRGDYEGIYEFLDTHAAKECGDSVAVLQYEYQADLVAELKESLARAVAFDRRSRVYVVVPGENGKPRGRFIVGKRKHPVWSGYGTAIVDEEDVGE